MCRVYQLTISVQSKIIIDFFLELMPVWDGIYKVASLQVLFCFPVSSPTQSSPLHVGRRVREEREGWMEDITRHDTMHKVCQSLAMVKANCAMVHFHGPLKVCFRPISPAAPWLMRMEPYSGSWLVTLPRALESDLNRELQGAKVPRTLHSLGSKTQNSSSPLSHSFFIWSTGKSHVFPCLTIPARVDLFSI